MEAPFKVVVKEEDVFLEYTNRAKPDCGKFYAFRPIFERWSWDTDVVFPLVEVGDVADKEKWTKHELVVVHKSHLTGNMRKLWNELDDFVMLVGNKPWSGLK